MGHATETSGTSRPGPLRRWGLVVVVAAIAVISSFTTVDRLAEQEYEQLFQRALVTFALARTLNGVISAVQGTELALQPAGVGVTLTPGEILDPVNDLVERFSWIMLGATISLGVQQVLLDVGQWWGLRAALALVALAWLVLRLRGGGMSGEAWRRALLRVLVVMVFLRFAVPLTMIVNEAAYRLFLEPRYAESTQVIESAGAEIGAAVEATEAGSGEGGEAGAEEPGWLEQLGRGLDSTREALDFRERLELIRKRAADWIEHLVQLSVVFILQTGLLPIAFLWIFLQLFKQLVRFKY